MNVLFVCLGNTCRSPLAEGILKKMYAEAGINALVESAGFESYNINELPDSRAIATASKHGIDLTSKRARLFSPDDFDRFDRIYVMDGHNMQDVSMAARSEKDMEKVDFLLNVHNDSHNQYIQDPYRGGIDDYNTVYELMEKACVCILELAKNEHGKTH
jgi:protein-tyrosine phosphatase